MASLNKELVCRVAKNYGYSGGLLITELDRLGKEVADLVGQILNLSPDELQNLTCAIQKRNVESISGDKYIAKKLLKLKFSVVIEECELIDDREVQANAPL